MFISLGARADDATPQRIETSWDDLVAWFYQQPRIPAALSVEEYARLKTFPVKSPEGRRIHGDKDGSYIVLGDFGGGTRSYSSLLHSSGIPLDFDTGHVTRSTIEATLAGLNYVAFTTYAHQPDAERWRVLVPSARPMTADEHRAAWHELNQAFQGQADPAAKDATRLSYLPGRTLLPAAAEILHGVGEFYQPPRTAPAPPAVLQTRTGPVPGWSGPSDDVELLTIACNTRTRPDERFGGPIHFAMLWTGNEQWLRERFPGQNGQPWDYTQADMALAGELIYFTGGDVDRSCALLQASGLAAVRGHDSDWVERKVPLAVERAAENAKQYHFMRGCAQPAGPADLQGPGVLDVTLQVNGQVVPPGTTPSLPALPDAAELFDPNAPPSYALHPKTMTYPATLENVIYMLGRQKDWLLGYDEFRGRVMIAPAGTTDWRPVTDNDQVSMREAFGRHLRFDPVGKDIMRDSVALVAERHKFDSAQLWLTGLVWDGVPRVETYLQHYCGVADAPYIRAVSRYIWTGLAGRVMSPGCQLDMVVAFQSPQGRGKSTGLAAMVPDPECFTDGLSLHEGGDDFKRMLKGKLVVEIAELAGLSKADVNAVKMTITRRFEEWVEKWETQPRRFQRRCMLFASTNEKQFLPADDTGNRRWLPVPDVTIDRERIAADRLQLWAEGLAIYSQSGIAWQDAERLAPEHHAAHTAHDVWDEAIEAWLTTVLPLAPGQAAPLPPPCQRPFSMPELLRGALHLTTERQDMRADKRAGSVLRRKGYELKSIRTPTGPRKLWTKI